MILYALAIILWKPLGQDVLLGNYNIAISGLRLLLSLLPRTFYFAFENFSKAKEPDMVQPRYGDILVTKIKRRCGYFLVNGSCPLLYFDSERYGTKFKVPQRNAQPNNSSTSLAGTKTTTEACRAPGEGGGADRNIL